MSNIIDYPNIVQLSIWEELVCAYDGSLALFSYPCERNSCLLTLFSYPCVRNSYVHFLSCSFYNDDQRMFLYTVGDYEY